MRSDGVSWLQPTAETTQLNAQSTRNEVGQTWCVSCPQEDLLFPCVFRRVQNPISNMGDNRLNEERTNNPAIPETTRNLVVDFILHQLHRRLNYNSWQPQDQPPLNEPTELRKAVRKIGDDFEGKYRSAFNEMFANLHFTPATAQATFLGVINELFSEGVTWGRIVALFAFGGEMAVQCVDKEMDALLDQLAEWMTAFIDERLIHWIDENGGWNGFMDFYHLTDGDASSKGFKKIMCGLAAGAIGALTIGAFLATKS